MIACTKCKAQHNPYHLREEDKVFEDPVQDVGPISILANMVWVKAGFSYIAPKGLAEASMGGALIIIRCPACSDPKQRDDNDLTTT